MKIARYEHRGSTMVGVVDGERVLPVAVGTGRAGDKSLLDLAMAARLDPTLRPPPTSEAVPLADVRLLPPISAPPSVRDFYAFEQHVKTARGRRGLDVHPDWYEIPVFYFSNPAAVIGPGDPVPVPPRSERLDFELEVAVVIGQSGPVESAAAAGALVAGFCVMNDWSARDIQVREMAQSMGPVKGKDFATSLGPLLVTVDEFAPGGLQEVPGATMTARVNSREYSRSDLATLWWSFAEMLAYAAESTELRAGDVIGSGTCGSGCILELSLTHGEDAYPWLRPGDEVELEVEGLGVLANPVVAATAPAWRPDPERVRPERAT
ncbi:MAG: fumarylacetoacetate hydrolase family protein [Mycobacteriales bacterium]